MTKPQSHKNYTHVIIGSRNTSLLTYINSLCKESSQYLLTPTLACYMTPDYTTYDHTIKSQTYIPYQYTHHVCKPEPQISRLRS